MSKYNVGDRFLIEIDKVVKVFSNDAEKLYKIKGFNSLVFDKYGLDKLPMLPVPIRTDNDMEEAKKEAYEAGLKDAWEVARKICCSSSCGGMNLREIDEIFDCSNFDDIFNLHSPKKAVEKIKEYEEEKEKIHVGDVVKHKKNENVVLVVTRIYGDGDFSGMKITKTDECGHLFSHYSKRSLATFEKTGQHYDLNEIFKTGCD